MAHDWRIPGGSELIPRKESLMDHAKPDSSTVTSASADGLRRYSGEFKREVMRLITEEKYKFRVTAQAVGVSEKSLRDWH